MRNQVLPGAAIVLSLATTSYATVLYVDDDALPGGNGQSWNQAVHRLQDALDIIGQATTEIRIAGGTYKPDQSDFGVVQPGDRSASFVMPENIMVRGGYAGLSNPGSPDLYDPDQFPTILSGDLLGNDMAVDDATKVDNSERIIDALLDGGFAHIEGLVVRQAFGSAIGAGVRISGSGEVLLRDLDIHRNYTDEIHAGIRIHVAGPVWIERCKINNNSGVGAVAGNINGYTSLVILDCEIKYNSADVVISGLSFSSSQTSPTSTIVNTVFVGNTSPVAGASVISATYERSLFVNCLFAKNSSDRGSAVIGNPGDFSNCIFVDNVGRAFEAGGGNGPWWFRNCIFWDNDDGHFTNFALGNGVDMDYSCIEGGWDLSGIANIDDDPMFVQPGTNNYRLSHGSPCLNKGVNIGVPFDTFDLDNDGDTSERIPIDLAGAPRVQNAIVDMGAYEGSFDGLPPADQVELLDQGEFVVLVPSGQPFAPGDMFAMFVQNISGGDNAIVTVTDFSEQSSALGGGLPEDVKLLSLETTLADGSFVATVIQPFDVASQGGNHWTTARATVRDPQTGDWVLAPFLNAANSPGYDETIGDLILNPSIAGWSPTGQPGDYGAVWEQALLKGFAWAHVDRPGEYGLRFGDCPSDCAPPGGNGAVDIRDMLFVLENFGALNHRWCDLDFDDVVDADDMGHVFEDWGGCP